MQHAAALFASTNDNYRDSDVIRVLFDCGHLFHWAASTPRL
jgi:hypothetical protein